MIASLASVKSAAVAVPLLLAGLTAAAETPYKVDTRDDILKSAKTLAEDLFTLYDENKFNDIPGILPGPPPNGAYYWWQGGVLMSTFLDYFRMTGDNAYNDAVAKGIMHQTGPNYDFLTPNWTASIGNDDQCAWAMTALDAAEAGLADVQGKPSWTDIAKSAFATMADPSRHDGTCGGGLRWQIPQSNAGYDYKNSISNGCFLSLAARLAKITSNETYESFASETWEWLVKIKLLDEEEYRVYDGAHVDNNCTDVNKAQFSINSAYLVQGAAYMYNQTQDDLWRDRLTKITAATLKFFFPDNIAYELPCEQRKDACNNDMRSFKGIVHRYLASATEIAPFLAESVLPVLKTSTEAAIKTCTGGESGRECGFFWSEGKYIKPEAVSEYEEDVEIKVHNAGEQMNVLAAVSGLLIDPATGGPASPASPASPAEDGPSETTTGPGASKTSGPANSGAGRFEAGVMSVAVLGLGALFLAA